MATTAARIALADAAALSVVPSAAEDYESAFWPLFLIAFRAAHRILGDRHAAEDAAAEALTNAHLHWNRIASLPYRDAWVVRAAGHRAIDILRRLPEPATAPRAAEFEEGAAMRVALVRELRALPRRQREVVVLRFLVGLPPPDVAAVLGIGPASVHTHLARGMRRLRMRMGADLGVDRWD